MFTGIIETTGTVTLIRDHADYRDIEISAAAQNYTCSPGDSVAVDGVCLTLTSCRGPRLTFQAVRETTTKTTLARIQPGHAVNLERAVRPTDRLGGHFVTGHIDGTGRIAEDVPGRETLQRRISLPVHLMKYMAEKGSTALDGISLTIAKRLTDGIIVAVIPYTFRYTTLPAKRVGDEVNIECDIIARYLETLISGPTPPPGAAPGIHVGSRRAPASSADTHAGTLAARMKEAGF